MAASHRAVRHLGRCMRAKEDKHDTDDDADRSDARQRS
jgi:hypothetical protein